MFHCVSRIAFCFILSKDLLFAIAFCIKKYTCLLVVIVTDDDERNVRNIFYLIMIMLYIAVCCVLTNFNSQLKPKRIS